MHSGARGPPLLGANRGQQLGPQQACWDRRSAEPQDRHTGRTDAPIGAGRQVSRGNVRTIPLPLPLRAPRPPRGDARDRRFLSGPSIAPALPPPPHPRRIQSHDALLSKASRKLRQTGSQQTAGNNGLPPLGGGGEVSPGGNTLPGPRCVSALTPPTPREQLNAAHSSKTLSYAP